MDICTKLLCFPFDILRNTLKNSCKIKLSWELKYFSLNQSRGPAAQVAPTDKYGQGLGRNLKDKFASKLMLNVWFVSSDVQTAYIMIRWNRASVVVCPKAPMMWEGNRKVRWSFINAHFGNQPLSLLFTFCKLTRSTGGPLETTAAADSHYTCSSSSVCALIDCTGAQRGCYKPLAFCNNAIFSAQISPASHLCTLPLGHGSMEVMEKARACCEGCRK